MGESGAYLVMDKSKTAGVMQEGHAGEKGVRYFFECAKTKAPLPKGATAGSSFHVQLTGRYKISHGTKPRLGLRV